MVICLKIPIFVQSVREGGETIEITKEYLKKIDNEVSLIPLSYDFAFKRIFSKNPDALKDFLIKVLELDISKEECSINLINTELPKQNKKEYKKTVDLNVILNNRIYIDVEVNRKAFNRVKFRNSLYQSKLHTLLLEEGKKPDELKDKYIYQLNLNAYEKNMPYGEDIIVSYGLKTKCVYVDNKYMVIKYLEYYRDLYYNKNIKNTDSEIWLAFLTAKTFSEAYEMLSKVLNEESVKKIIGDMIDMSWEGFSIHEWEKEKMDALVEYETFEEGKAVGLEEGKTLGLEEKSLEIAKSMLLKGMDIDTIAEITKLSTKEIEALK